MDTKEEQLTIAEGLQLKLLKHFEKLLEDGDITSTDLSTLCRLLSQNGWVIDPTRMPKGLLSKLTANVSPDEFAGGQVLPFRKKERA